MAKIKYVLHEGEISEHDVSREDGGQALIVDVVTAADDKHPCLWVQIKSWDKNKQHPELKDIVGKTVTVTIEIEE